MSKSRNISATFYYGNFTFEVHRTGGGTYITRGGKVVREPSQNLVKTALRALDSEENGVSA